MMQRRPNPTELRSMDSNIQILCRVQTSKLKVPPPSLPCTKKTTLYPSKDGKNLPWGDFLVQGSDSGGSLTFLESIDLKSV